MAGKRNYLIDEKLLPNRWYNLIADLPWDLPIVLHPKTKQPITEQDLVPIFARELIKQEMTKERWVEIPSEILDVYRLWRPTPLRRAYNLEKVLRTPARIYFKDESVSPTGSHKPNTAVAQVYYNKKEGINYVTTETGAGQWGSAVSFAANIFGIKALVYMVKVSFQQKPYRKTMMQLWGADVIPSPSQTTESGKAVLQEDPDCPGSLGIAISEAVEVAAKKDDARYILGSVLNHVLLHQSIVGLETQMQLKEAQEVPDVLIGCVGGGSNFGGFIYPFVREKLSGKLDVDIIAVEPKACPTLTRGDYKYDYGDSVGLTPFLKMFTLGYKFVPSPIHAGGLRYHGMAPVVSLLKEKGVIEAVAYEQTEIFEAASLFAKCEGIVPAPESAHAIKAVVDMAKKAREEKKEVCICFVLSGHGLFDLSAYEKFLSGKLEESGYGEKR